MSCYIPHTVYTYVEAMINGMAYDVLEEKVMVGDKRRYNAQ